MAALTSVPGGELWRSFPEATRNEILGLLAGALLADADGVYDPDWYNDRLLLGLKGTMTELELHLIRQRMASGRFPPAGQAPACL